MSFLINDANLPAILRAEPMTDEEFIAFCSEHPDLNFEMSAEGELIVMAPTHSDTGARSFDIAVQLGNWAKRTAAVTAAILPQGSSFPMALAALPMRPGR